MSLRSISLLIPALIAVGCAGMQQTYRETICNYDGAYKQGVNDARQRKEMSAGIAYTCNEDQKKETERGYRDGYTAGLASLKRN